MVSAGIYQTQIWATIAINDSVSMFTQIFLLLQTHQSWIVENQEYLHAIIPQYMWMKYHDWSFCVRKFDFKNCCLSCWFEFHIEIIQWILMWD